MRIHLPIALLLLAGCSSHASKQDQLNAATNESTPEAGNTFEGAAQNGTENEVALNEASSARANSSATARKEARSNLPKSSSAQQPAAPSPGEPDNSNSD